MSRLCLLALGLSLCLLADLVADPVAKESDSLGKVGPAPISLFHPDSYIVPLPFGGHYWFEARIAPEFVVFSNLLPTIMEVSETKRSSTEGGSFDAFALLVVPEIQLRMNNGDYTESEPVRTPSYRPHGSLDWYHGILRRRVDGYNLGEFFNNIYRSNWISSISSTLIHYSNGQEGDLFSVPGPITNPFSTPLNTKNGDYSSTFFTVENYHKFFAVDGNGIETTSLTLGFGFDYHPNIVIGGKEYRIFGQASNAQREIYDPTRIFVTGEFIGGFDEFPDLEYSVSSLVEYYPAVSGVNEAHANSIGVVNPWRFSLTFSALPNWVSFNGLGLFMRIVSGQDYYNVHFRESISQVFFGISLRDPARVRVPVLADGS